MHDIAACCRVAEDIAVYLGGVKNDDVPRKCWVRDAGREGEMCHGSRRRGGGSRIMTESADVTLLLLSVTSKRGDE